MYTVNLSDGRTLAYEAHGDPDGLPVIFSHGLSDSRMIRHPDEALTRTLGIRFIAVDQPGVGGSSPMRGRKLRDYAQDIEQFADRLEIEQFAVAGHSAGGPHALAIAAFLPDRVIRGVLAAPASPLDLPGLANLVRSNAGLMLVKLRYFSIIVRGLLKTVAWWANQDIDRYLEMVAKTDSTDGNTDIFLADPEQRQMFLENFTAGFAQGAEGVIGTLEVLWEWGFSLKDIPQRFDLFYGDCDAAFKPELGNAIAELMPDSESHEWSNAGHYGFIDRQRWSEFLGVLKQ